jgi:tungstate transport system ATP-binding protein
MKPDNELSWLALQGVSKHLGGREVLQELDMALHPGEVTLLTGDNGAGKTTLLMLLAGLWPADAGELRVGNQWLPARQARRTLRQQAVYLHQSPYLFHGTVADNVRYGLRWQVRNRKQARQMAEEALEAVGLPGFAPRRVQDLSGGERQRVALARAWVLQPRLLLMDEPFASMDAGARRVAMRLVAALPEKGHSLVLTSHNPTDVGGGPHRHLYLANGRLHAARAPEVSTGGHGDAPTLTVLKGGAGR